MFLYDLQQHSDVWGSKKWAVFTFLMSKSFWVAYFMPLFAVAISDTAATNRLYGIYAGASAWIMSLVVRHLAEGLHTNNVFTTLPFSDSLAGLDAVMIVILAMSMYCLVLNSSGAFDGFSCELHVPITHRRRLLVCAVFYWLFTGVSEAVFVFSSETMNSNLENTDWVWPPDYTDCSKQFSMAYALCKPLLAAYVTALLFVCRRTGLSDIDSYDSETTGKLIVQGSTLMSPKNPKVRSDLTQTRATEQPDFEQPYGPRACLGKHHHLVALKFNTTCKMILVATICCWCVEIIFAILEQAYGVKYHTMGAFVNYTTGVTLYDYSSDPCRFNQWLQGEVSNATEMYNRCTSNTIDLYNSGHQILTSGHNRAWWSAQSVVVQRFDDCRNSTDFAVCAFTKASQASYRDLPNMICVNSSWHLVECTSKSAMS